MSKRVDDLILNKILTDILQKIHSLTECQSVGIRLQNNGDYPYFVHEGFTDFFILKENSLCTTDNEGNPVLDEDGEPVLGCVCGSVLKGKTDSTFPFFTENGSFWTNSTSQLLATDKERLNKAVERIKGTCPKHGYESMALIPLRVEEKILGLIQLNDPRENMFTLKSIKKYEQLADEMGKVIFNVNEISERISRIFNWTKPVKIA